MRSRILAALLHGTPAAGVSQTLRRGTRNGITELSQRVPPIFGRAVITLGIGPHSSCSESAQNNRYIHEFCSQRLSTSHRYTIIVVSTSRPISSSSSSSARRRIVDVGSCRSPTRPLVVDVAQLTHRSPVAAGLPARTRTARTGTARTSTAPYRRPPRRSYRTSSAPMHVGRGRILGSIIHPRVSYRRRRASRSVACGGLPRSSGSF